MSTDTISPKTMAWGLLVGMWQRRFIDAWTVGEITIWRARILRDAESDEVKTDVGEGGRRGSPA
jgi:uncharacterized membrane protein (DUF485 family)